MIIQVSQSTFKILKFFFLKSLLKLDLLDRFVLIRLTSNGTTYFENLRKNDKKFNEEMNMLRIQISNSIPVDEIRLEFLNEFVEFDRIERNKLLFITFKINPPDDNCFNQKSSEE